MSGGVSSGRSLVGVTNPGTLGAEITSISGAVGPSYHGFKSWTFDPTMGIGNNAIVAGDTLVVRVPITQSFTAANLSYIVGVGYVAGSGVQGLSLYNDSGTQIGTCPDQSAVWNTTGMKTAALTVVGGQSLAVVAGTFVWVMFLSAASATPPSLVRSSGNIDAINAGLTANKTVARAGRHGTAQSAFPTPSVSTNWASVTNANIAQFWVGIS